LGELGHGEELVLFYHDEDEIDDIPSEGRVIAEGFDTPNAFYVGNDRAAALGIDHLRVCYETVRNGKCQQKCHEVAERDYAYMGKVDSRMARSRLHSALWAISGQIEYGDTVQGHHGDPLAFSWAEMSCEQDSDRSSKTRQWSGSRLYLHIL
jgi:hypothetical protein